MSENKQKNAQPVGMAGRGGMMGRGPGGMMGRPIEKPKAGKATIAKLLRYFRDDRKVLLLLL